MLDRVDNELIQWISGLPGSPSVVLNPPPLEPTSTKGIHLYLLGLRHTPPQRGTNRSSWPLELRYLVTAHGPDLLEAHQLLANVLIAAIERDGMEVESQPLPWEAWLALGAKPQPAFILCVPWVYEKQLPTARPVLEPLVINGGALVNLSGTVVGPGDKPLMYARVELPALGLSSSTDHHGRFHFSGTPQGMDLQLRVVAKGKIVESRTSQLSGAPSGIVIKVPVLD